MLTPPSAHLARSPFLSRIRRRRQATAAATSVQSIRCLPPQSLALSFCLPNPKEIRPPSSILSPWLRGRGDDYGAQAETVKDETVASLDSEGRQEEAVAS